MIPQRRTILTILMPGARQLIQHPMVLARLSEQLGQQIKVQWQHLLVAGDPFRWPELAPATQRANARTGRAQPHEPLTGSQPLHNRLGALPIHSRWYPTERGVTIEASWLRPGDDLAPSEQLQDLFLGSPISFAESARYGTRGVTPPRPLLLDASTLVQSTTDFLDRARDRDGNAWLLDAPLRSWTDDGE